MNATTLVAFVNLLVLCVAGFAMMTAVQLGDLGPRLSRAGDAAAAKACFRRRSCSLIIAIALVSVSGYFLISRMGSILEQIGARQ